MTMKRITAVLLMIALLITMMPSTALAAIDPGASATYSEGAVLIGGDGGTYQFPKSEQGYIKIRYIDLATGKWKVFDGQYESGEPKRSYVIQQNGSSYRGYCVEHGVHVDSGKKLTANEQHDAIYAGLSNEAIVNLQLALFYGYQSGDSINDLYNQGFQQSKYYGKHGSSYAWADWYIATQCLVWEIQQGNRTDNMTRQTNELGVSGDHYLSMISGRPAVDVYNWMVAAIKEHKEFPRAIDGTEKKPKTIQLTESMKTSDGYEWTFDDTTGNGGGYVVLTRSGKELKNDKITITYSETSKKYVLHMKGEPNEEGYVIQHASRGKAPEKDLLFWGWQSGSSHVQTIVTGAADPVAAYIKFTAAAVPEEPGEDPEGNEKPVPEYFPTFEFTVSKEDLNPGWDGNTSTGMGDASLAATYTLYRSVNGGPEEMVDSVTLDEYGSAENLYDQPWPDETLLTETESGSLEHTEEDEEGNVTIHCTVEPTQCEWTAEVSYRIAETRPAGRFIEPDSGERTYTASYYAVTENSQACMDEPENWSDIQYTVTWSDGGTSGTIDSLEDTLSYDEDVFINDCYRGRLFLSKSNESGDVFNEEGSSGVQTKSKNSKWKMYLKSGGFEEHPYIRFVEEGLDASGTRIYRVVRDTSGANNAVTDMTVGTNGCIYIYDIPYGSYRVEEVAADDTSFVLESFDQFIGEHGNGYYPNDSEKDNRYDWNIRDKKKENVVKVIKTDAETGKAVDLTGTHFYIRYMGNPLLADPTKSENYGRLLPNAADINSTEKDYTFICDENGEITIPYDLEFGTYQLEEFLLPDGYYVNEGGTNYYTFSVTEQNGHLNGTEYEKYYQAVAMPNNQVKGKISIEKEGEMLTDFEETTKNGIKVWTPKYTLNKLKDAVFGIFAAEDIKLNDGNDGPMIYDSATGKVITIPTDKSAHSGNNADGAIYDEGTYDHESGAKLYFKRERDKAEDNRYLRVYTTPEQKPSSYSYVYETTDGTLNYRYDVNLQMEYKAGGKNVTDVDITKTTSVANGYLPTLNEYITYPSAMVGDMPVNPIANYESAFGNVLDVWNQKDIYEADGEGELGNIGVNRFQAKLYEPYLLTAGDVAMEEREVAAEGSETPEKVTKTHFEWENAVTLFNPAEGLPAVCQLEDGAYQNYVTHQFEADYQWVTCDETGSIQQYTVPEGWTDITEWNLGTNPTEDPKPIYPMISQGTEYKVLLEDGITWQDCQADGNFEKMAVQEYKVTYTQEAGNEEGFSMNWDGIEIAATAKLDGTAETTVSNPFSVVPTVSLGIGYTQTTVGNNTTFTAAEPSAPVYFLAGDGIRTEMYYYGGLTKTILTIPMDAVDGNFSPVVPTIRYGEQIIDWFTPLSPDHPTYYRELQTNISVKAERHEGTKESDVYYTVTLISNQTADTAEDDTVAAQRPFAITYADGYTATIACSQSAAGNGIGVLVLDGIDKTTRYALSDLVEIITTGDDGTAVSSALPLGTYIIRELSAPDGQTADTSKSWLAKLKFKDQFTVLVWDTVQAVNEAFAVEIDLRKVFETGFDTRSYVSGSGAVFGIYNAEPIAYSGKQLKEDTCLDVIAVDGLGRALAKSKLPEGLYYLKEVKTRDGYYLNEMPYYFAVGDVKSEPLYISRDTDGADLDGMTIKAVMESYGKASITIDLLTEYPNTKILVNSSNTVHETNYADMTRYQVEVTESMPADITLPNGKTLTLTVDGSTYSYIYDGQTGQYVSDIAYTGYFAKFVYEEKQEDVNSPKAHTLVMTSAKGSHQLTAETVHEPVMIPNPENPEDPEDLIQKVDDKGNKVFDYFLNVSLDGAEPVRLDEGEKTSLKAADGSVYIVEVAKDRNITVSVSGSLTGAISDGEEPAVTVDGVNQEGMEFAKSVTFARQDSAAKTVQIKINTLDNLTSGEIRNDAKDVPKGPDVPYIPAPSDPTIRTTATDRETNDHISEADKSVTIVDTVTCWNLTVGREYVLKGVLMDQATGGQLLVDGKPVTAETRFKATTANGSVDVTFTFDGSELGGKSLVVFEELFLLTDLNGDGIAETATKVAEHQDITDEGQTVLLKAPEEEPTDEPEEDEPEEEPKPTPEEPEEEEPKTNVPKTGDSTPIGMWILILLISGGSILLLVRKNEQE